MKFKDITHDQQTTYRLQAKEEVMFFMLGRTGELTFELAGQGGIAHILSLSFETSGEHQLKITQHHLAPNTVSHFYGKNIVGGNAHTKLESRVIIEKEAAEADTSQDCRTLLLSDEARGESRPFLEIKTNAVRARHAATTSTLRDETLFYMASRGLDPSAARSLSIHGFVNNLLDKIPSHFQSNKREIKNSVEQFLEKI